MRGALEVAVEANRSRLGGELPLRRAEEDGEVRGVDLRDARGHGLRFERVIDGAEDDGVLGDVDQDPATGEVGDNLVILSVRECCAEQESENRGEEKAHGVLARPLRRWLSRD